METISEDEKIVGNNNPNKLLEDELKKEEIFQTKSFINEKEKINNLNNYNLFPKKIKNIKLKKKIITIFHLYYHLNRPIDYIFILLAFIGSVGSGISIIIQAYISSDIFSEIGNTSERNSLDEINNMMEIVEKSFIFFLTHLFGSLPI